MSELQHFKIHEQPIGPQRQLEAGNVKDLNLLVANLETLQNRVASYTGRTQEEHDALFGMIDSYHRFLEDRYRDSFKGMDLPTEEARNNFLKSLIGQELTAKVYSGLKIDPLPGDFKEAVGQILKAKAEQAISTRELCEAFGIKYDETDKVFGTTTPARLPKPSAGEHRKPEKKILKLNELVLFLLAHNLTGDQINITKSQVKKNQKRTEPYELVTILSMNKQILVCDLYGEGAYVSQSFNQPGDYEGSKKDWVDKYGLELVKWDEQGHWLKKIEGLLWPEPGMAEPKPGREKKGILLLKDGTAEEIKDEVLKLFPTSGDYLRFFDSNNKIVTEQIFFRQVRKALGAPAVKRDVTIADAIKLGQNIYGQAEKPDANLEYALKLEERDAAYFKAVFTQGLPEGVNYFLSDAEIEKGDRPLKAGLTDMQFVDRYLVDRMDKSSQKMTKDLHVSFTQFVAIFCPEIHSRLLAEVVQRRKSNEKKIGTTVKEQDVYAACLKIYPDSRQFQYLRDLDDPAKLKDMIRGEYDLSGLKGILIRPTKGSKTVFDLAPGIGFKSFDELNDRLLAPSKYASSNVSLELTKMYGFGCTYLATKMGFKPKVDRLPNYFELLGAFEQVYPDDPQVKYLIDKKDPEKMKQMIKGEYNLKGRYIWNFLGQQEQGKKIILEAKPCPNYESFKEVIFDTGIINDAERASKNMRKNFGFGAISFATAMGAKENKKEERGRVAHLLKALQELYPESRDEIQNTIDEIV